MNISVIQDYAHLLVHGGLRIRKGEVLIISTGAEGLPLARAVTQEAYRCGASRVELDFSDEAMARLHYLYRDEQALTDVPRWDILRHRAMVEENACYLGILCEDPKAFIDVPASRLQKVSLARHKAMRSFYDAMTDNRMRWCLCAVPTPKWAKAVFPDLSLAQAERKLGAHIASCMRLDASDPVQAWQEHDAALKRRVAFLNTSDLQALHIRTGAGTDLTVRLPRNYRFEGGSETDGQGQVFHPNMPSEEVFCSPDRMGVDGVAVASMPLIHNGTRIEDFSLTFRGGKVVSYTARVGKAMLEQLLQSDRGARYLGEIALVSKDSPIRQTGCLFSNTLFDENAACHLALGQSYPTVSDYDDLSPAERLQRGLNRSHIHVDFMIGTDDTTVDGIRADGTIVPVMRDGSFVRLGD